MPIGQLEQNFESWSARRITKANRFSAVLSQHARGFPTIEKNKKPHEKVPQIHHTLRRSRPKFVDVIVAFYSDNEDGYNASSVGRRIPLTCVTKNWSTFFRESKNGLHNRIPARSYSKKPIVKNRQFVKLKDAIRLGRDLNSNFLVVFY